MINHGRARAKWPHAVGAGLLAILVAGCGGDGGNTSDATTPAPRCATVVDDSGWRAFTDVADRIVAGETVSADELLAVGDVPAVARWRASLAPHVPPPLRVSNWIESTFWRELGKEETQKVHPDRRAMAISFRWSWDQREVVEKRLAELRAGGACTLDSLARTWFPAAVLPETLHVDVLPGKPELRYQAGHLILDSGVLAAGTTDQAVRQLMGLIQRSVGAVDGPNPVGLEGIEAVAHTFRVLHNEGLATWFEDRPRTVFRRAHPTLGRIVMVPEDFWQVGTRMVANLDTELSAMAADPSTVGRRGRAAAERTLASGGFNLGSWCLVETIAARLGPERLREAAGSIPAFCAAYQEAALLNGDQPPAVADLRDSYHLAMPAFSPAAWSLLERALADVFPD